MFEFKDLGYGCAILCPDMSLRTLAATVKSIRNYSQAPIIAVVPKGISKAVADEMKKLCDVVRGGSTYSSLINTAVQKTKADWCFVIFAGSIVKSKFVDRYSRFVKDDKDILFPVMRLEDGTTVQYKINFVDGSLNGVLMHTAAIKEVGPLPELPDIQETKLTWAYEAISKGYRFVGILGSRIVG